MQYNSVSDTFSLSEKKMNSRKLTIDYNYNQSDIK